MPQLAPYVELETSWRKRSVLYRNLMSKRDTILLLAETGGELIGYGVAHVVAVEDTWASPLDAAGDLADLTPTPRAPRLE